MANSKELFERRRRRARWRLRAAGGGRPRLSVFRSNKHIYAQIIDDRAGKTVAAASSMEKAVKPNVAASKGALVAEQIGKLVAERALAAGVTEVVFDRGGYRFHGRIKALAEAARGVGLKF